MKEISGDRPLTRGQQFKYFLIFLSRFPGLVSIGRTKRFVPKTVPDGGASLFRKIVDAFLTEAIPSIVTKRDIAVFDIGCGSGYARRILGELGYSGAYTGLDIVHERRFDDVIAPSFVSTFVESAIESYPPHRTYDFVMSNTALEHVESATAAVAKAHELAGEHGVEIHIVPSWWSFFLYLWHGYRHYTPRSLSRLFAGSDYTIYRLGGAFSLKAQFWFVTIPERYLGTSLRTRPWYPRFARTMIRLDRFVPLCPMGYAVIVNHETRP